MKRPFALGSLCLLTSLYALLTPFMVIFNSIVWHLVQHSEGAGQWFSLIGAYLIPFVMVPFSSLAWYNYGKGCIENALLFISIPGLFMGVFYSIYFII